MSNALYTIRLAKQYVLSFAYSYSSNTSSSMGNATSPQTGLSRDVNSLPRAPPTTASAYHPRATAKKSSRPSLSRIILSLESNAAKQRALQHVLDGLQIMRVREAVVSSLLPHSGVLAAGNKNRVRVDMANDTGKKIDSCTFPKIQGNSGV